MVFDISMTFSKTSEDNNKMAANGEANKVWFSCSCVASAQLVCKFEGGQFRMGKSPQSFQKHLHGAFKVALPDAINQC